MTDRLKDIGYLKLLFESGENSEVFQEKITEFFPALIYVYDPDNHKLCYINKQVEELLGYTYDDINSWDNDFMKFVFKEDVEHVKEQLQKFYKRDEEAIHSFQSRLNHKNGNWRYFRTHGITLRRKDDGNPASLLFISEDITDQMQTRQEAEAIKHLHDDTENLLHFGTWSWTIKTGEVEWSDGLYSLMGHTKFEQPKITFPFFLQHINNDFQKNAFQELIEDAIKHKSSFEYQFSVVTGVGEEKILSVQGKVVEDDSGEVAKVLAVTRDVTQQILSYNELLDYKQMMMDKEKFLGSGSWEFFIDKGLMKWSEGKYCLFGYDPEKKDELPTVNLSLYEKHINEQEIERLNEIWQEFIDSGKEHTWEYEITTAEGERRLIESYGKLVFQADGKPFKVIGASRDVTTMRTYEESLKQKIAELDRSNKELEEFAYIASHDLQEPLRKITAFSERLKEKAGTELGREGILYLDRMMVATENMRMLIDNLLEFSRTSRHNQSFEKTDLNKILHEAIADLELKIEETGTSISADHLPIIKAIPTQIRQLFINLLANAIKFGKPGTPPELSITVSKLSRKEKEQYLLPSAIQYHKIIFKDQGIGFEQEYAVKIFQIFQRLHGKSEYPGSGIGLAICKKIIDNHHGIIYAESQAGQGADFVIILPEN